MKKKLICNKTFDKKQITNLIEWFIYNYGAIRTSNLINKMKFIGFKFSTKAGLSLGSEDLKIPSIKDQLIKNTANLIKRKKKRYKDGKTTKQNLLKKEIAIWNITNDTLKNEIIRNFRQTNLLNPVYMMIFSGARGNISQIKQLIGMRGLMSDAKGEIISLPIKSSLKEGLNSKEYFISCYGARKGIIDTALKTANSGYLTRKLIYAAQNVIIKQQDCKTLKGEFIKLSSSKKHNYNTLKTKLIGTIVLENILDKKGKKIICKGQDICPYLAKKIIQYESHILLRSILSCKIYSGVCQLCYGWNLGNNKVVRIGETVGILAAQSIGEPGTQLTMRTFHTGGVFTGKTDKVITSPHEGHIIYKNTSKNGKKIKSIFNENAFVLFKENKIFVKKNKYLTSQILLPESSIIFVKPRQKIFNKQIIAQIIKKNPIKQNEKDTQETKCYNSGQTYLKNGKKNTKYLWIVNGYLTNNRTLYTYLLTNGNRKNCKSMITKQVKEKIKRKLKGVNLIKITYNLSKKFKDILKEYNMKTIYTLKRISKEKKKIMLTKNDNASSLKKEFKPRTFKSMTESGKFSTELKGQITEIKGRTIKTIASIPYLVPKQSKIKIVENELIEKNTTIFKNQYKREKTKDIIEGLPKVEEILEAKKKRGSKQIKNNLHEFLKKVFLMYNKRYNNEKSNKKAIRKIQRRLIEQIQEVYNSQGVNIAEKHISIIARQVTSKVMIIKKGDSNTIEGEIIDIQKIERINRTLNAKAVYEPILIGISKTSLVNEGFISSICFQETVRTLSKCAIKGEIDWLTGLKENIILGNLIPAGTGIKSIIE